MIERKLLVGCVVGVVVACGIIALAKFTPAQASAPAAAAQPVRPALPAPAPVDSGLGAPPAPASPEPPAPARGATADHGWPDRRPVGAIFMSDRGKVTPDNPSGWYESVRPDPERFISTCLRLSRQLDVQAVLFWDVEGSRYEMPVTYVGDPRVLPPERSLDALRRWSQRFRDIGVKVGGTIRPQVLIVTKKGAQQYRTSDYYAALAEKVSWARDTLGWTVFYVDTNTTAEDPPKRTVMPAEVFARLAEDFPDCLFVPEFSGEGYADVPRVCPMWFDGHIPGLAARGHPWGVLKPTNKPLTAEYRAQYVAALKAGCITLVTVTWDNPDNGWIMDAEHAARPPRAAAPPESRGARPAAAPGDRFGK